MPRFLTTAFLLLWTCCFAQAQKTDPLNTAAGCIYMKPVEREMIYEINRVRHEPKSYLVYLDPMLKDAKEHLKIFGKGPRNYSLTFRSITANGISKTTIDTTWNYSNEEEVKAITGLINDLKKLKPLSVLIPDTGIYAAAKWYGKDEDDHQWTLMHNGSDGSDPWDRITRHSPQMSFGNENIAGRYPEPSARDIVIQLLIDSGIPGYGHRYNLLDPQWTHVACYTSGLKEGMFRWLQEFGRNKN